eukprot:snap_masked-scaffold_7-processed-gene-5.22-mRNA-1 protein AED:0.45 eAED:0.45 QI:52/1/0.5/1/1/1/2/0/81
MEKIQETKEKVFETVKQSLDAFNPETNDGSIFRPIFAFTADGLNRFENVKGVVAERVRAEKSEVERKVIPKFSTHKSDHDF